MSSRALIAIAISMSLAAIAALASCNGPDGTTPSCTEDVSANGIDPNVTNGCSPFPKCDKGDPAMCCAGFMGSDFDQCMYGYGVGHLSTTSGMGGAGGSGGAAGSGGAGGTGG